MNTAIKQVNALEILDSRGMPTIKAEVVLENGVRGSFSVPSGASKGAYEALEQRDGDKARYNGFGVLGAVENIRTTISHALNGLDVSKQEGIDNKLLKLDGTKNKSKLGANAILAVSFATCRAAALASGRKLYHYLDSLISNSLSAEPGGALSLPTPLFNVMNGGAHADNNLSIQEFIIIPRGIKTFAEKVRAGVEIDYALKSLLKERGATTGVGDEGGFAPNLPTDETAIDFLIEAIERSKYKLDTEIVLGLDVAASQYYEDDDKVYAIPNIAGEKTLVDKAAKITAYYTELLKKYPVVYLEDPLDEDDWEGWKNLAKKFDMGKRYLVGDDLTATNLERIERAAKEKCINALIIKPNQIGTLSEVIEVIRLCDKYKIHKIISHRSGETTDTFISDLAVASRAEFIKDGAPIRGERVAKYNRLIEIEAELESGTQIA